MMLNSHHIPRGAIAFMLGALGALVLPSIASARWQAEDTSLPPSIPRFPESVQPDPVVRAQAHDLARFLSLRNSATIGVSRPSDVGRVLSDWTNDRVLNEQLFGSNDSLTAAYREVRSFLVQTRQSVLPEFERLELPAPPAELVVQSPEVVIGYAFLSAMVEIRKREVLRSWQHEYDARCRDAYGRIIPILRVNALGDDWSDQSVRIRHWFADDAGGVFLEALNESGKTLTNVTLHAQLQTLDGQSSDHYYFIDRWVGAEDGSDSHRYSLRLAADWWQVGAAGTTSAIVSVYSDEIKVAGLRCAIDDNIPFAADMLLDEIEAQIGTGRQPKLAINRLARMRSHLGDYPDRRERVRELDARADEVLESKVAPLDKKIDELSRRIAELSIPNERPKRGDSDRIKRLYEDRERKRKEDLQEAREQLRSVRDERNEWVQGVR
ncbi:MAG: hypothetical protein ACTS3F_04535 [Phycisphaerales bacterium]